MFIPRNWGELSLSPPRRYIIISIVRAPSIPSWLLSIVSVSATSYSCTFSSIDRYVSQWYFYFVNLKRNREILQARYGRFEKRKEIKVAREFEEIGNHQSNEIDSGTDFAKNTCKLQAYGQIKRNCPLHVSAPRYQRSQKLWVWQNLLLITVLTFII